MRQSLISLDVGCTLYLKRCCWTTFTLCILLLPICAPSSHGKEKLKQDKFRGTVVNAGPKAITVKSKENAYLVRTFNYSPPLEKKLQAGKPAPGKEVTVHYLRGTDLATKVD